MVSADSMSPSSMVTCDVGLCGDDAALPSVHPEQVIRSVNCRSDFRNSGMLVDASCRSFCTGAWLSFRFHAYRMLFCV